MVFPFGIAAACLFSCAADLSVFASDGANLGDAAVQHNVRSGNSGLRFVHGRGALPLSWAI